VVDGPPLFAHRAVFLNLATAARLPVISGERQYTDEGGLISYGPSYEDHFQRAAEYVDKILKGTKPRDLPVQQPTKFLIVVNQKTARALEVVVPDAILLRADEVIR
jgi:putative ABC transport system substrate-binding protein